MLVYPTQNGHVGFASQLNIGLYLVVFTCSPFLLFQHFLIMVNGPLINSTD